MHYTSHEKLTDGAQSMMCTCVCECVCVCAPEGPAWNGLRMRKGGGGGVKESRV